jgi:hypothetical protein
MSKPKVIVIEKDYIIAEGTFVCMKPNCNGNAKLMQLKFDKVKKTTHCPDCCKETTTFKWTSFDWGKFTPLQD